MSLVAEECSEEVASGLVAAQSSKVELFQRLLAHSVWLSPAINSFAHQDLDLDCCRLRSIPAAVSSFPDLWRASFRTNWLTELSALAQLQSAAGKALQLPRLEGYTSLHCLDASYNKLSDLQPLASLSATTKELYLSSNSISSIQALAHLTQLSLLELGANRVQHLQPLQGLTQLQELWLGDNHISSLGWILSLQQLQKLSLQSNRLTAIDQLAACTMLEELWLSHNGITSLQALGPLQRLRVLDASSNAISELSAMPALASIQDLWLESNKLESWDGLLQALEQACQLSCLTLQGNPVYRQGSSRGMWQAVPSLQQLDQQSRPEGAL